MFQKYLQNKKNRATAYRQAQIRFRGNIIYPLNLQYPQGMP